MSGMWKKNRSSQPSKENPLAKHIEAFKIARSSSSKWIRPCYAEWDHATQITVRNLENHEIKGEVPLYKLLLEIRHLHIPKNPKNFRFELLLTTLFCAASEKTKKSIKIHQEKVKPIELEVMTSMYT